MVTLIRKQKECLNLKVNITSRRDQTKLTLLLPGGEGVGFGEGGYYPEAIFS